MKPLRASIGRGRSVAPERAEKAPRGQPCPTPCHCTRCLTRAAGVPSEHAYALTTDAKLSIGRSCESDIHFELAYISSAHCRVEVRTDQVRACVCRATASLEVMRATPRQAALSRMSPPPHTIPCKFCLRHRNTPRTPRFVRQRRRLRRGQRRRGRRRVWRGCLSHHDGA